MGLLGTYNRDPTDDLTTLTGTVARATGDNSNAAATQMIYESFGQHWLVDGRNDRIGPVLFQDRFKPIYNPQLFANSDYRPVFWPQYLDANASRVFTVEQVKVACMGIPECEYDYMMTGRREVALETLQKRKEFMGVQRRGSKLLISCGPLLKKEGVIKVPPAANYLDGDTVTFSCKPRYFIHGDITRKCVNGTWTPGWWAWCRDRNLEYALKWMTALLSIFAIVLAITIVFCVLWSIRRKKEKHALEDGRDNRRESGRSFDRSDAPLIQPVVDKRASYKSDPSDFLTSTNGSAMNYPVARPPPPPAGYSPRTEVPYGSSVI